MMQNKYFLDGVLGLENAIEISGIEIIRHYEQLDSFLAHDRRGTWQR